jgi:penicillin-binding protein 1A
VLESIEPPQTSVISPETAFFMTSMLRDVVSYGTGRRARAVGLPVAGKTGTTNDYRDAWFIGYSKGLLAGVWVGFDDMKPMGQGGGHGETGSTAASPIWADFVKYALSKYPSEGFDPAPEGIVTYSVDAFTGAIVEEGSGSANTYQEHFRSGTAPTEPLLPMLQETEKKDFD